MPDRDSRREIFQILTRDIPLDENIDLEKMADRTDGFSGADISALIKEATFNTIRRMLIEIELVPSIISQEVLSNLKVIEDDFESALKIIVPSSLREITTKLKIESIEEKNEREEKEKIMKETLKKLLSLEFIREITFERISYKLNISINQAQDLIETLLKSGEIQGYMMGDKFVLEKND